MIKDLNLLYIFYVVANSKSISKASEKLYISQPAVSQNIKMLEADIKKPLFYRKSKGVELTFEGQELYKHCKAIFDEVNLMNQSLEDLVEPDSGILKIGASDTICKYYLIDKLKSFERKYPKIRYRVTNCTTSQSLNLLKDKAVDLAFIHGPIFSKKFLIQSVFELNDVFVCAYDFDDSNIKHFVDLKNYRILLLEESSQSRKMLDQCLLKYNVVLKPKFELASLDLLIEFCKKNMGIICVAKEFIERELENKELKIINIAERLDKRNISIAINESLISNQAKRFIEHIN